EAIAERSHAAARRAHPIRPRGTDHPGHSQSGPPCDRNRSAHDPEDHPDDAQPYPAVPREHSRDATGPEHEDRDAPRHVKLRALVEHQRHREHQDAQGHGDPSEDRHEVGDRDIRARGVQREAEDRPDDDEHAAEQRQDERGKRSLFQAIASIDSAERAYLTTRYIFRKTPKAASESRYFREPLRAAVRSEAENA